jgi:hypothetical protein
VVPRGASEVPEIPVDYQGIAKNWLAVERDDLCNSQNRRLLFGCCATLLAVMVMVSASG